MTQHILGSIPEVLGVERVMLEELPGAPRAAHREDGPSQDKL